MLRQAQHDKGKFIGLMLNVKFVADVSLSLSKAILIIRHLLCFILLCIAKKLRFDTLITLSTGRLSVTKEVSLALSPMPKFVADVSLNLSKAMLIIRHLLCLIFLMYS